MRLPEDFLGKALRVHIRGVEEIDPRFQTHFDQTRRFFHIGLAPRPEEFVPPTECAGAKAKSWNF